MTPARAHLYLKLCRTVLQLAVITLAMLLTLKLQAQDNKPQDCVTYATPQSDDCKMPQRVATATTFAQLDWWPLDTVPESLRDRQCINCGGRYIDPLGQSPNNARLTDKINARADRSWMQGNDIILFGQANAIQGERHMRADRVIMNRENESATLNGNITLREPGILLLGDSAEIYSKTGEVNVFNSTFVFQEEHMRGSADILQRDGEGLIHIHNGSFTYCAPAEDDWVVLSNNITVDLDEGLATARDARIEIEGVPAFYTPWLRIPLDDRRRTGLLWPDWGNDSSGGLDISVPLYVNLAPNYDALYAPRFIEDRGLDHQLQLRYMNPRLGDWFAGGAYLADDKKFEGQSPENSSDRWLAVLRQNGLFKQRWRSRIDYSKASDVDYLQDLETANIDALRETSLLQLGSIDYLGDKWLMTLQAQKFQSLADDISNEYEKLPQFTSRYRSSGAPFTVQPILMAQYSNFDASRDVVTGQRVYGEAGLSYPMLWSFGFLKPTIKYRQVNYDLSNAALFPDNSPSAGAPLANLDGALIFERQTSFAGSTVLQTLEPRLYYLYSEREDQSDQPIFDSAELTFTYYQLFRETRFSGHDRLDDANQISLGLTSRLIDDVSGRNLLTASAGQIYYFADREVRLGANALPEDDSKSEFAANLSAAPTDAINLRSSLVWDPDEKKFNSGFAEVSYTPDSGRIFNLGYNYRRASKPASGQFFSRPQTEEASFSTYLPLDNNWSIFGAISYSLENDLSIEDMFGLEYDSCCWTVRLLQLRYYNNVSTFTDFDDPDLERESTIQFQFLLKGMGGFGSRITNVMRDMIRGFEERDY